MIARVIGMLCIVNLIQKCTYLMSLQVYPIILESPLKFNTENNKIESDCFSQTIAGTLSFLRPNDEIRRIAKHQSSCLQAVVQEQHFFSLHCQGNRMRSLFSHTVVQQFFILHVQVIFQQRVVEHEMIIISSSSIFLEAGPSTVLNIFKSLNYNLDTLFFCLYY